MSYTPEQLIQSGQLKNTNTSDPCQCQIISPKSSGDSSENAGELPDPDDQNLYLDLLSAFQLLDDCKDMFGVFHKVGAHYCLSDIEIETFEALQTSITRFMDRMSEIHYSVEEDADEAGEPTSPPTSPPPDRLKEMIDVICLPQS